jgi:prepilin-type processing-associated H-X9-DG protein
VDPRAADTVATYDRLYMAARQNYRVSARHNKATVLNCSFFDGHSKTWTTAALDVRSVDSKPLFRCCR